MNTTNENKQNKETLPLIPSFLILYAAVARKKATTKE